MLFHTGVAHGDGNTHVDRGGLTRIFHISHLLFAVHKPKESDQLLALGILLIHSHCRQLLSQPPTTLWWWTLHSTIISMLGTASGAAGSAVPSKIVNNRQAVHCPAYGLELE